MRTVAVVLFATALVFLGADNPPRPSALRLIREKCLKCHSGEHPPNGLRLDSVDNMVRGGKSGPAIVPFNPDRSLIYKFVIPTADGAAPKMPPFYPLEEAEVALLRRWIQQGAHQMSMSGQEP